MPWYRPNGQVGGYYSAKDYNDHKTMNFAITVGLISAAGLGIVALFDMVDWQSVGGVTTIVVRILAIASLVAAIIFPGLMGAIRRRSELATGASWAGYGVRMLILFLMVFSTIVSIIGDNEGTHFITFLGMLGFFASAGWVVIGGIVGFFLMGFKAILPALVGFVGFILGGMLTSQGGDQSAVLFAVPVIAGSVLLLMYHNRD